MDEALAAGLAQQKARKVAEALVPALIPDLVAAQLPAVVLDQLPSEVLAKVKATLPDALAAIYVPPKDGTDGLPGKAGLQGPEGKRGPSGFDPSDAVALIAAWADLKAAILTPRPRKVIRDNMGRITGLTEG